MDGLYAHTNLIVEVSCIFPSWNVASSPFAALIGSVAEPHHFYVAPAPALGENFDGAPAPAVPAPTLLYS
jgi:hypothetical protein